MPCSDKILGHHSHCPLTNSSQTHNLFEPGQNRTIIHIIYILDQIISMRQQHHPTTLNHKPYKATNFSTIINYIRIPIHIGGISGERSVLVRDV